MKQQGLVDQIGRDESRGKRRTALDHQPGDAARCHKLQHSRQIEPAMRAAVRITVDAVASKRRFSARATHGGGNDPKRHLACGLHKT